jgi:hypothetical protein
MRVATQEKTIPSCRVDKSLLQEIERYMMAFFEAGGHFRVAVKYARGAETYHSASELKERFAGAVQSVELQRCRFADKADKTDGGGFNLNVSFDRSGYSSRVVAEAEGEHAKERIEWFMNGILEIIEPYRAYGGLYHFHPAVDGALSALTLCLAVVALVCLPVAPPLFTKVVGCAAVLAALHRIGAVMIPYSAFSSRRVEIRAKVWRWVLTGTAGAVLFGIVLTTLLRRMFGF